MNGSIIYEVGADGGLSRMHTGAPANEAEIQLLIAQYPEIITETGESLLLVRPEQPIADSSGGPGRWSLDHLFVSRSGQPVLVEVKQATNNQLRREVVGQILDYAANAVAHWSRGRMEEAFRITCERRGVDPVECLQAFLGSSSADEEDGSASDSFWQRAENRLQAGDLRLVIVADKIPRELARVVEFLNEQMRAEVRAVELNWFQAGDRKALVPRIIGHSELAAVQKKASAPTAGTDYWQVLDNRKSGLSPFKPWTGLRQNFDRLRIEPQIDLGARFEKVGLRVFVYLNGPLAKAAYTSLLQDKSAIEQAVGEALEWDPMVGYSATKITLTMVGETMDNRDRWEAQQAWIIDKAQRLRAAFKPFVDDLSVDAVLADQAAADQ